MKQESAGSSEAAIAEQLIARAALYNKVGKHVEALADSERALNVLKNIPALYQKGISSYHLKQYETASSVFEELVKERSSSSTFKEWKTKCDIALASSKSTNENGKNETAATATASTATAAAANPTTKKRVKYDWYQSPTEVVITILAKDTNQETAVISMSDNSLSVDLPDHDNFSIRLDLFSTINVKASSFSITKAKVEIKLAKAIPHVSWPLLERPNNPSVASSPTVPIAVPQKLPSAYASKTPDKWNKIEKEAEKELEKEKPKGDEAFMELMKKIYKDADEDTRRAMNKSYQTSGGTVLSTNWGEVRAKDYEKEVKEEHSKKKKDESKNQGS